MSEGILLNQICSLIMFYKRKTSIFLIFEITPPPVPQNVKVRLFFSQFLTFHMALPPQGSQESAVMERISFERRLDMEKAQQIYEKNLQYLHFEHTTNSLIVTLKLQPKLAEILSIQSGGSKPSVGCEQVGNLTIGQKQYSYTVNYSIGGVYGDVRIRFNDLRQILTRSTQFLSILRMVLE